MDSDTMDELTAIGIVTSLHMEPRNNLVQATIDIGEVRTFGSRQIQGTLYIEDIIPNSMEWPLGKVVRIVIRDVND